jgi:hypothetical protein
MVATQNAPGLFWRQLTFQEEEKVGGNEFISGQHRIKSPCCVPRLQDISVYRNTPSARVEHAKPSNMSARVVPFHRTRAVSISHVPDDDRLPEQSLNKLPSLLAKNRTANLVAADYSDPQHPKQVSDVSLRPSPGGGEGEG